MPDQDLNQDQPRKATGPRTIAGKLRSSQNSRRHQLSAQTYVAPPDQVEAFEAFCAEWREALQPVGVHETKLCNEVSSCKWRVELAASTLQGLMAQGHLDHADSFGSGDPAVNAALAQAAAWNQNLPSIKTLLTYEQRLRRAALLAEQKLESVQQARKEAHARAFQEAVTLCKEAAKRGVLYQPEADFEPASAHGEFVYARHEIARHIDREYRLANAETQTRGIPFRKRDERDEPEMLPEPEPDAA